MAQDNNTRRFSYSNPIRYGGHDYPSAPANILDSKGNASWTNVFADASGKYFVLGDNGNAKPVNVDWEKTRKSQSKFIKTLSDTYGPIVAAASAPAMVSAFISAPLASIATGIGGMAGGYAVNKASEAITDRNFGTNVAMHTPLTPGMGEMLNPGYVAGGYGTERRMLDALYNQVAPISYGTPNNSVFGSKVKLRRLD